MLIDWFLVGLFAPLLLFGQRCGSDDVKQEPRSPFKRRTPTEHKIWPHRSRWYENSHCLSQASRAVGKTFRITVIIPASTSHLWWPWYYWLSHLWKLRYFQLRLESLIESLIRLDAGSLTRHPLQGSLPPFIQFLHLRLPTSPSVVPQWSRPRAHGARHDALPAGVSGLVFFSNNEALKRLSCIDSLYFHTLFSIV